jgi:uncharacterized protein (DUF2141 family)
MIQMAFGGAASTPPTGVAAMALYAAVPVTVNSAEVAGVAVTLVPGATLTGRVEFQGTAPPPDLRAGQGLNISLTPTDRSGGGLVPSGANNRVTESGTFSTRGYPPGRYAVSINGGVGQAWMLQSIAVGGRDVLDSGFELRDADLTDVVVTYSDKIGQMSGTVHASSGTAAAAATVVVVPSAYRPGLIASGQSPRRARSIQAQKSGAYTLNAIGAGDYVVAAFNDEDAGDLQDAAFIANVLRSGTHVSIAEGEKKSLDLTVLRITR